MNSGDERRSRALDLHLLGVKVRDDHESYSNKSEVAGLVAENILGVAVFTFLALAPLDLTVKLLIGAIVLLFAVKISAHTTEIDLRIHTLHTETYAHFLALVEKIHDPKINYTEARLQYLSVELPTRLGSWGVLAFYWVAESTLWIGGGLGIAFLWERFLAAA